MKGDSSKCFFHVDLDAFFASVEQVVHPEYRGKPVIISGDPHQRRNVVSTASYEARKYGVHSAMPSAKALELCPNGIFVPHNMRLYCEYSDKVMDILSEFSPDVMQLSIDEACLDMTGTERLFGKPEEAAQKIKDRVKNDTGLTISIGIATNSYLAKICSEIRKPDGLYRIMPGDEEAFMERLPLKDVWGVGEKTLSHLNSCGLKTVSDIKSHSLNFLSGIFGDAGASFLYNVCRGLEPENFRTPPKSHTQSVETTFEYDITDRNAIETALLYLSSELMERLLKESKTSLTVQIKLRYEDFTTVTAQCKYETPILCIDDLYERALSIFDKKYEFGRGVRLLGVGVQNVIGTNQIIQPELFETGNEKKQTVEKAILDLESKYPKIKVQKARLLNSTKALLIAVPLLLLSSKANAQNASPDSTTTPVEQNISVRPSESTSEQTQAGTLTDQNKLEPKYPSNGTSLFKYSEYDKEIELEASGFWNMELKSTANATFGYGKDFNISWGVPVFEQEVDFSLWFLLNNHWYISGAFADKFNKNTYTLGYSSDDGLVKDAKISNRNIVFPETYSLSDIGRSIGGGDNQAPGASVNLSKDNWTFDAAIRYDMLAMYEKTFYGKNAVTNIKLSPKNYLTGTIFVLPSSDITKEIKNVYVESSNGNFIDSAGKKYKLISSNNYMILPNQNQLILSKDAGAQTVNGIRPCVVIEFESNAQTLVTSSLGYYGSASDPGPGFLGKIQKFFGKELKHKPDVAKYSYGAKTAGGYPSPDKTGGTHTEGFFTEINSKSMLLVQNSTGFSPFQAAYRYDGGINAISDVQVASSSTEQKSKIYSATVAENINLLKTDFFNTQRTYVDVFNPELTLASLDGDGEQISYKSPEINFPLADRNPGVYLGYEMTNDDCIMLRSISQSSRIDIGTKAVPGTVKVYKNGIHDASAKYNAQSGEITLAAGISDTDKLYIIWYEDSTNFQTGQITGAAGFKYDIKENLFVDVAAATRWGLNPELKYSEADRKSNGYVTVSSKVQYEEEKMFVSNVVGATLDVEDVTGNYKISGMDNAKPTTAYLPSDAAKNLPQDFTPCINPRPEETGSSNELSSVNNCSVSVTSGTASKDISGYYANVSYNFSRDPTGADEVLWASDAIYMSANKGSLSNASKFNLAVKLTEEFVELARDSSTVTKVYLQLGVSSDSDFKIENKTSIPTWTIFDSLPSNPYTDVLSPIDLTQTDTGHPKVHTVSVILRDEDRAAIRENTNARIIITTTRKPSDSTPLSGAILIGPYETVSNGIYAKADNKIAVSTEQKRQNSDVTGFNKDPNYVQNISWQIENFPETNPNQEGQSRVTGLHDSKIKLYKYFKEVDISSYKSIDLWFAYNVGEHFDNVPSAIQEDDFPFTVILDRNAPSIDENGQIAVELKIKSSELKPYITCDENKLFSDNPQLHHLKINRITREVTIDGKKITECTLNVNQSVIPTRLKIMADTVCQAQTQSQGYNLIYEKGKLTLDEFYLSDCSPKVVLQDQLKTSFKSSGDVLSIKDFSVIKDAELNATGDFISDIYTDKDFNSKAGVAANADAAVTLATIRITNQIGRSSETENILSMAGHTVSTTNPILKVLSFEESFTENKDDKSVNKYNSATLNFSSLKIPLVLKGSTKLTSDSWSLTQDINDSLSLNVGNNFKYGLSVTAKANQKINSSENSVIGNNYFDSWLDATKEQFSLGSPLASKRIIGGTVNNKFTFPFASFAPELNFAQNGAYTSTSQNLYSDTTDFSAVFPFKVKNLNISFTYAKSGSIVQNVSKGGTYETDISTMCSSMSKRVWYFTAFPIYDLFSDDLASKVLSTTPNAQTQSEMPDGLTAQSSSYNSKYELSFRRPIFATKYDLFVPTIATLAVTRDIATAENITDTIQAKLTLGYTAVNIFCKDGPYPFIKWCKSDEYNLSVQGSLKIPKKKPEDIKQLYSLYLQANFFKTDDDVLRTAFQFSYQDKDNFNGKAALVYERESKFSPVTELIKACSPKKDLSTIKMIRSNSLNFAFSSSLANSTNAKLRQYQSIEFTHMIEYKILKQLSINGNIAAGFTHTRDEICSLTCTLGLGGKLTF